MHKKNRLLVMAMAVGIGLSAGWQLAAQQAATGPNWKDAAESDIYYKDLPAAKDDKGKIEVLNKWAKNYPDSELWQARDEMFLSLYFNGKDFRKLVDKTKEIRAKKPDHYLSLVYAMQGAQQLPSPTTADIAYGEEVGKYIVDNADKIFVATNKPAGVTDEQFAAFRPDVVKGAWGLQVWAADKSGDKAKLEQTYKRWIEVSPSLVANNYQLAQVILGTKDVSRYPEAIFHIARAASYTGKDEIPAAQRQQLRTAVDDLYKKYHGSEEGMDQVIEIARTNPMPPSSFSIKDINTIRKEEFDRAQAWDVANPDRAFWRDLIRGVLTGPDGQARFNDEETGYKGAMLPPQEGPGGAAPAFTTFRGKIVSMTPEENPKAVVVAVYDPNSKDDPMVADATLEFPEALKGTMPIGTVINFKGAPKSFTPDPFMVIFDMNVKGAGITEWPAAEAK